MERNLLWLLARVLAQHRETLLQKGTPHERSPDSLLPRLASFAAVLLAAGIAHAGAPATCADPGSLGKACTTAGPTSNQSGICEPVVCTGGVVDASAAGDGGPTCLACLIDGTAGGCGGSTPRDTTGSFAPVVGGCCSVAGTAVPEGVAGLVLGAGFFGLALLRSRRPRRSRRSRHAK